MHRSKGKKTRSRGVGRPSAQAEVDIRAALMSSARELFLKHGFEKVTARQIAAEAGTTPAMIHYYFENKIGLFRAMVQDAIEPLSRVLESMAANEGNPPAVDLKVLISGYLRTAAANAWIAPLVVNEVLPEGGKFRAVFVRDIASRLVPKLVSLIEHGREQGQFRRDIDPHLTALSIVSLNVFPLISRPITAPLLGFKLEGEGLERLIEHTTRLLLQGIGPSSPDVPA